MTGKKPLPKLCYKITKDGVVDLQTGVRLPESLANAVRADARVDDLCGTMLDWYNSGALQISYVEGYGTCVHKIGLFDVFRQTKTREDDDA